VLVPGRGGPGAWPPGAILALVALTYLLTALYAATLRYVERRRWLVDLQLAIDAALVAAIVLATGGVASSGASLFVVPVMTASVLQQRRGGVLVAALSVVLYGGIVAAQYSDALPWLSDLSAVGTGALPPARDALFSVALNGAGFLAVAVLAGYLAADLQRVGRRLEEASSEIADLQAFSRYVIDSLTGGLATTDRSGRVLTFNRAATAITGISAPDAQGKAVWRVLQLPLAYRANLDAMVDSGRARRVEVPYVTPGGRRLELGLTVSPLETSGGRAGFIFTFQDLTDEKRRLREGEVQKKLAAVGQMAAGIAHEIRNPLASITGSIQVLQQEAQLTDEQAGLLSIVLRESRRLDETIRNFLAYARPRPPKLACVDVRGVLGETAMLLRNSPEFTERHRVSIETDGSPAPIELDEAQVRQVVWNLATNGLRAMPDGGTLRLRLAEWPGPQGLQGVVLSVEDAGVGMTADELEELFQPFRSSFPKGTGLGLAIVHRIVTEHGGEVSVTSAPGAGTTVRLCFPASATQAGPAAGVRVEPGGSGSSQPERADDLPATGTYGAGQR
jgi:two-component system sensor histidine kinase PilS (NtrC family)